MGDMGGLRTVWVFNGAKSHFPSAVFTTRDAAELWILNNKLTGTLTQYPVDIPVYDWATQLGYFKPEREDQRSPDFIGRFSAAQQEHYHYEDGAG
jgi:hypothetical protein